MNLIDEWIWNQSKNAIPKEKEMNETEESINSEDWMMPDSPEWLSGSEYAFH